MDGNQNFQTLMMKMAYRLRVKCLLYALTELSENSLAILFNLEKDTLT